VQTVAFHERNYKVYVILGKPGSGTPWSWSEWRPIAQSLQPVIDGCRGKPLLRSVQAALGTKKWVQFGKLVWSDKHHEKWTHGSPATAEMSREWSFYSTELAAPSLQVSSREKIPPDLFLTLTNEEFRRLGQPVAFNPLFFFALATDMAGSIQNSLEHTVRELAQRYEALLTVTIDRPWGKPWGSGFTKAIQDMPYTGLFKIGNYHTRPLTLDTFEEKWKELS
jgi:hypothetical protein